MADLAKRYPDLFAPATWYGNTQVQFSRLSKPPDESLIANINIVPFVDKKCLVIRLQDGSYEIPGGTLEPGEGYLETVRRELLEEAGAQLIGDTIPVGAWQCEVDAPQPYKPHLPHPVHYRYVVYGEVKVISSPTNPSDAEQVAIVELVPLDDAVQKFQSQNRTDIADLFRLAWTLYNDTSNA